MFTARGFLAIVVCCKVACFKAVANLESMRNRRVLQPINNNCADAIDISVPYFSQASTNGVVPDDTHRSDVFQCGNNGTLAQHFDNDIPRLYFKTIGTGGFLIAKLCSKLPAQLPFMADGLFRKLYLFKGECGAIGDSLECLDVSESFDGCRGFIWQSEAGQTYFLAAESNGEVGAPIFLELFVNEREAVAAEVTLPFFSGNASTVESRRSNKDLWYVVYGTGAYIVGYVCDIEADGYDRTLDVWVGDCREAPVVGMSDFSSTTQIFFPAFDCQGLEWKSVLGEAYCMRGTSNYRTGGRLNLFIEEDTTRTTAPTESPTNTRTDPPTLTRTDPPTSTPTDHLALSSALEWGHDGLVWLIVLIVSIGLN